MPTPEVTVDELADAIAQGARVIDVRETFELEEARLVNVQHVALATVPDHVSDFRSDQTTYVICRSGGRSMQACEFVAAQGCDVANVQGGILAWIASGRDIITGAM